MSTKACPYCAEDIKEAAVKCRHCGSMLGPRPGAGEWYRDLDNKMFSGVCAGLARQFGVSVTALRIAFVIAAFLGGLGVPVLNGRGSGWGRGENFVGARSFKKKKNVNIVSRREQR